MSPVLDASGRVIAPAQNEIAARPDGPWQGNRDTRQPAVKS